MTAADQTPATDSGPDERLRDERLRVLRERTKDENEEFGSETVSRLLDEIDRLTALLAEQAETIEPWDGHWSALYDQITPLAAEIQKDPEYEQPSLGLAQIFAQSQIGYGLSGDERYTFEKYVDARRQNEWFARKHPLGSQRTEGQG